MKQQRPRTRFQRCPCAHCVFWRRMLNDPQRLNVQIANAVNIFASDQRRLEIALRDLLALYDRVTDSSGGHGWSTADVKRLEEIRKLCSLQS